MTLNQTTKPAQGRLHPATHMGPTTLAVSDLSQSVDFYSSVLGMKALDQKPGETTMGAGSRPLLILRELPGARPQPDYSTGLYHVAILLPTRADLGRVIINLARRQYPIGGFGDHFVSEAMYLSDPDGNGLEIYRDRPRSEWQWNGSQVVMGTEPVDVEAVVASVENPDAPFAGMPDGTVVGHMHLRVGDIPKGEAFYRGIIGFDVVAKMPSALFVSAGGYHHHLGMNIWHSRNAPRPPADSVGLRQYTIVVPDADTLGQLQQRLSDAGVTFDQREDGLFVDDPWGNRIRVVTAE
jgi:catechol 2,3-dioxygenase